MEIRSGDELDFRRVYAEVFPTLMRVAYHVTYNKDVAEDICQDTFIRFYDKNIVFPSMDDAKYWLIRVAKNLCINAVKKKMRETASLEKMMKGPQVNPFKDGQTEVILQESADAVRKAVSQLSMKHREVIVLREYAGLSYAEIAKVLKTTEGYVKVCMHRARKELGAMLDREEVNVP